MSRLKSIRPLDGALLGLGALLVAVTLVVAVSAGGSASGDQAAAPPPAGAPPQAGGDTVTIKGFEFMPDALTVKAGTTVTWVNNDTAGHTASSSESGAFDTGAIDRGEKKSVKLAKPGTYPYICEFHPFMKGTVTVR